MYSGNLIMKSLLIGILLTLFTSSVWAQNIQWAFKVLEYSTQETSTKYSSKQILGKPNVFPGSGQSRTAWQSKGGRKDDFIKVGFLNPMKAKQIVIAETFHPGYISKVYIYDADGKEYEAASFVPADAKVPSRLLQVNVATFDFYIFAVKIEVKAPSNITFGIDAIGITETPGLIKLKMSKADIIKSNMVSVKLDSNVNSIYPERGPLVSPDGKTLYFSRSFDPENIGGKKDREDIWYSEWDSKKNKWSKAKNMGDTLNNSDPNFINSISPDGNSLFLGNTYGQDGRSEDGVSISKRTSSGWSFPKTLNIDQLDNKSAKANYFLSSSMKTIVLSIEQKNDTYGDRDLYVSFMVSDSTWSKPLNLGKTVNTIGTESGPFLASDDRTLYYSSDGLSGYGGADIYVTRRLDDTWQKWSEPENLGPVVNSSFDESFFSLSASGKKVFYTSTGDTDGDFDIRTISLAPMLSPLPVVLISGRVLDSKTKTPLSGVKIFFENLEDGKEMGIAISSPNTGKYQIILPSGSNYGYLAAKTGYLSSSENVDLKKLAGYSEYKKDLYLSPIEVGQSIAINNLFFDTDKFDLRKESFPELNRICQLLKNSSTLVIEISGHTDSKGSIKHNDLLSYNRAKAVVSYLEKNSGVDKTRIPLYYYGETKPVANNATAKGRQLNRRVALKIIAK